MTPVQYTKPQLNAYMSGSSPDAISHRAGSWSDCNRVVVIKIHDRETKQTAYVVQTLDIFERIGHFFESLFCCCCCCCDISAKIVDKEWPYISPFQPPFPSTSTSFSSSSSSTDESVKEPLLEPKSTETIERIDEESLSPQLRAFYTRLRESFKDEAEDDVVSPIEFVPFLNSKLCPLENILELSDKKFYFIPKYNIPKSGPSSGEARDPGELNYLLGQFRSTTTSLGVERTPLTEDDQLTLAFKLKTLGYPLSTYRDIIPQGYEVNFIQNEKAKK